MTTSIHPDADELSAVGQPMSIAVALKERMIEVPAKGKCQSCGENAFLLAKILINKENGRLYCLMICDKCRRFYEGVTGDE